MDRDLSFLIVTPHALRKGLSGVILSRLLSRTGLELAAAKIMAADEAFAKDFADALAPFHSCPCQPEYMASGLKQKHLEPTQMLRRERKESWTKETKPE